MCYKKSKVRWILFLSKEKKSAMDVKYEPKNCNRYPQIPDTFAKFLSVSQRKGSIWSHGCANIGRKETKEYHHGIVSVWLGKCRRLGLPIRTTMENLKWHKGLFIRCVSKQNDEQNIFIFFSLWFQVKQVIIVVSGY